MRKCEIPDCTTWIKDPKPQQKFCSKRCQQKDYRWRNRKKLAAKQSKRNRSDKYNAMEKVAMVNGRTLGARGEVACWMCGEDDLSLLTVGHPDGNGAEHRRQFQNHGGRNMILWILRSNHKEIKLWNLRVECISCNQFHRFKGRYPTIAEQIRRAVHLLEHTYRRTMEEKSFVSNED